MANGKEYNIKEWMNYITTRMMSDSERNWYLHWMKDFNRRLHNERMGQNREKKEASNTI